MVVGAISAGEKVEELPSKECQSTKAKLEGRRIANNNRRRPSKMIRRTIVWCLCCLLQWFALTAVQAQTIGDDVCGCSPRSFTFNLDLSLTCPPTNITSGGPVAAVSCIVSPFGAPSDDLTPIVVESISILELDQSNSVLIEERIDGNLLDGDSFTYTSVLNDAASIESSHQIPQALQLNLNGRNIDGVILLNVFIVTYSNRCGMVPVITEGHSTGWVVFTEMGDIHSQFCPTIAPSAAPFGIPPPTPNPTRQATSIPTAMPSIRPTNPPTPMPTTNESATSISPSTSPTQKPIATSLPSVAAPLTPTGVPSTTTSEATIAPSGYGAATSTTLPTIISQFPSVDMVMSMRLNFPWGDDNDDLRSSLLFGEERDRKRPNLLKKYLND